LLKHISSREKEFLRCLKCGKCRSVCPIFNVTGREMNSPRGRIALLEAVNEGNLHLTDALENYVANCLHCMRCSEVCSSGVHGEEMALAVNAQVADIEGLGFIKSILFRLILGKLTVLPQLTRWGGFFGKLIDYLVPEDSFLRDVLPIPARGGIKYFPKPSGVSFIKTNIIQEELNNPAGKVAYFIGCAYNYIFPEVPKNVVRYLRKRNIEVIVPSEQGCCGLPAYSYGDLKTANELAKHFRDVFINLEVDAVIVSCATCGHMLREIYPSIIDFEIPVMTDFEYILKMGLIPEKKIDKSVSYHAPCHLYRGQNVREEPVVFLESAFKDYRGILTEGECCGAGGFYHISHPSISQSIVEHKVNAFKDSGAQILLTACPGCQVFLDNELMKRNIGRCKHIFEVVNDI
jgi:glycolate oxidase iron-sulfur subunit